MVASILKSKKEIPNEHGYMDIDSTLLSILVWRFKESPRSAIMFFKKNFFKFSVHKF